MRTKFNSSHHVALALAAAVAVAGIAASGSTARATTATWTGGGGSSDTNWSDTANWSGGSGSGGIPGTGDTVDFGKSSSLTNHNDLSNLSIAELIFGYPAAGPDAFTLGGNALTITSNGYNVNYGVDSYAYNITETINNDINFNGSSNIRETSTGALVLTGTLSGSNSLGLNAGSGVIILDNTSGNTSTFSGSLAGVEGTVDLEAGTYTFDNSGYQFGGTVNQTGGNLTLGVSRYNQFATGVYNLGGGTATSTLTVGNIEGMGTMNVMANGSLASSPTDTADISSSNTPTGILTLEGGTATLGAITVNDGSSTSTATINLDSGTLATPGLKLNASTNGTAVVNSNGGTLEFSAADTIAASTAATWNVQAGGAIINTNGHAVTIDQALVSDATVDGGLTKNGLGTLNLASTANTYNGNTTVNAGTLEINSNFLASTSTVSIATSAVMDLNYSGTDLVKYLYLNGVSQAGGVYGANALASAYFSGIGTLTVQGSQIPEPATLALMGVAGVGLLTIKRRKKP